jgi:hypothetical protein
MKRGEEWIFEENLNKIDPNDKKRKLDDSSGNIITEKPKRIKIDQIFPIDEVIKKLNEKEKETELPQKQTISDLITLFLKDLKDKKYFF